MHALCRGGLLPVLLIFGTVSTAAEGRAVSGQVTDKRGNFLPNAVVQIEDSATLEIQSFIVHEDGRYHFQDLSADVDFFLHAQYKGHISKTATLSKFDGRRAAKMDFVIPIE